MRKREILSEIKIIQDDVDAIFKEMLRAFDCRDKQIEAILSHFGLEFYSEPAVLKIRKKKSK